MFRDDPRKRLEQCKIYILKNFRMVFFNPREPKVPQLSTYLKYFHNIWVTSEKNRNGLKFFCNAYPIAIYM